MAIFNPDVPNVNPQSYLGLSEPAKKPDVDTSKGELLEGIGKLGASSIKVAHDITEKSLYEEEYNMLTSRRDNFMKNMGSAYAAINASNKSDATASADAAVMSTTPEGETIPADVQQGLGRLATMQNAKTLKPELSILLDASLESGLKDLRARFPGWKKEIDADAKSITGRDSANNMVNAMIAQASAASAAHAAEGKDLFKRAMSDEYINYPGMQETALRFRAGQVPDTAVYELLAKANYKKAKIIDLDQNIAINSKNRELQGIAVLDKTRIEAATAVNESINGIFMRAGYAGDPAGFMDAAAKGNVDQTTMDRVQAAFMQANVDIKSKVINDLKVAKQYHLADPDKINAAIDSELKVHNAWLANVGNKEYSQATVLKRQYEARTAGAEVSVFNDPDLAVTLLTGQVLQKIYGPNAAQVINAALQQQDLPSKIRAVITGRQLSVAAEKPDAVTGMPANLNDDLKTVRAAGITKPDFKDPRAPLAFINMVESIADPKTDPKLAKTYMKYAFGEEGRQWLSQIERLKVDPVTGKQTNQQFSAYDRLVQPEFIAAAKKVGGQEYKDYVSWAEYAHGVQLLQPEVMSLKDQIIPPTVQPAWDATNSKYRLINTYGRDVLEPKSGTYISPQLKATFKRINMGLDAFRNIAKAEGIDVNEYVYAHLSQLAGQPGVPATELMKAIVSSHESNKKEQEEKEKALKSKYESKR